MSWPGVIEAGSTCHTPITGVDILPTFAELAGAKLPTDLESAFLWAASLSDEGRREQAMTPVD